MNRSKGTQEEEDTDEDEDEDENESTRSREGRFFPAHFMGETTRGVVAKGCPIQGGIPID